ncbi:MAG: D-glycero-beta-D-manno-heptose-7-phosphate kinase [Acidobacteriota bacterium]
MKRLKRSRAAELLEQFQARRILVIGDLMLDEFLWGRARRIAPEAPVPVVEIERETLHLGGAGNVAANLAALGACPMVIGVIGADMAGERLREEFAQATITTPALVVDKTRPTTIKTRVIAHSQHVVRTDREKKTPVSAAIERELADNFLELLESAEAVIVSDYEKGVITPSLLQTILPAAAERRIPVCIDPKLKNFQYYRPATIITPNQNEAEAIARIHIENAETLELVGQRLRELLGDVNILITRGEEGMSLFQNKDEVVNVQAVAHEVYDVTGAGDTVVATLTLGIVSGASILEAAMIANHAAGIVVGKVGTATVSTAEILTSMESLQR